ncbi:MAG: DUF5009 domain-containing protein, partial [Candidatus Hodarchaeales archaeon]
LRCTILFSLGIVLQSGYRESFAWELWNILTQLSVSIIITFLIFRFPSLIQLVISFVLLLITETLYRYFSIDGFEQPFVRDHNFGTFVDLMLMGKTHPDGWVAFNCIPNTAHMIWGVLTGNVIINTNRSTQNVKILGVACITALIIGYGLDWFDISPINKKISTGSFVMASGGWCLASFVFLYWLADIRKYRGGITFFIVVGMNPIFIYVFSRTIGRGFLNEFLSIFTKSFMRLVGYSESIMFLITALLVLVMEWYLCYWLYKKNIIIKI